MKKMTQAEWIAEGLKIFGGELSGKDLVRWRFKCPNCGRINSGQEFKDAGVKDCDRMAKECIGRYVKGKGCDWASYGLFDICETHVDGQPVFEFAPYEDDRADVGAGQDGKEAL